MKNLAEAVISARWQALGALWADENGTASRQKAERYCERAERRAEAYPRVTSQRLEPLAERLLGQADAEGGRVRDAMSFEQSLFKTEIRKDALVVSTMGWKGERGLQANDLSNRS